MREKEYIIDFTEQIKALEEEKEEEKKGCGCGKGCGCESEAQKKFGGVKRSELKDSDFLDSKRRSFPVKTCQDVKDAVSSWGRYKGSMTFDQFKSRLTHRANKLGCKGSLPDKWTGI